MGKRNERLVKARRKTEIRQIAQGEKALDAFMQEVAKAHELEEYAARKEGRKAREIDIIQSLVWKFRD